ncbi:MAG: response regulator transcription factor [Polyangiaceae bacterium]|nr:response regulator transcription factor [Polyangiaceae bacterium]
MARLLLVDDDGELLDVLALAFAEAGHDVTVAKDGAEAWARLTTAPRGELDLLVSDVNMPRLDGFALCRKLRAEGFALPIVLLTSRDTEVDEALGLDLGADDYVVKPFSTRVLLARVGALLRREALRGAGPSAEDVSEVLLSGLLKLDVGRMDATYAGTRLELTVTEFRILECFARRPGLVLARGRLLELVRDDDRVVTGRVVDTYVGRLRKKLELAQPGPSPIQTVVGAGYRWNAPAP